MVPWPCWWAQGAPHLGEVEVEVGGSSPAPRSWQHGCPRGHGDLLSAEAFVPLGRSCLIPLIAISIKVQRKVKAEKSLLS